jgi:hypothetical protein
MSAYAGGSNGSDIYGTSILLFFFSCCDKDLLDRVRCSPYRTIAGFGLFLGLLDATALSPHEETGSRTGIEEGHCD